MKIIAFLTRTRHPGRIHITDIMSWVWLVVGTLLVMIPVMWAAMSSFKTPAEINRFPPSFLPQAADTITLPEYPKPLELWQVKQEDGEAKTMALVRRIGLIAQLVNPDVPSEVVRVSTKDLVPMKALHLETENYTTPITKFHFATYLKNTVFVTVMATLLTLLLSSMAAFALSKYEFCGRGTVLTLFLSTMMIPLSVVMVPTFLVVIGLNMGDNLWGVIIPTIATPTGVFLLRQYMLTIPDELIEAARIDAASEFRIYWKIILPLTAPALAVLAIFSVIWRWNDFLWPLIVLSSQDNFTLQIGLNAFQGQFSVQWHYILAMTMLSLLPVTAVFVFLQKYITTGIANTGMK
ncbi:ABC transporter, membrane spanning protein [Pectobacterium atrosepticum]|nr:carbohydrate ABC transporter permease [Pectobacterium atrosepticum]AIA72484.1 ABC transporter permease [Pectobacterium atrosepticum]AIK15464.1 ABC transporter, membrane spanning protein [Pectobacterium atrosepticum]MCH5019430.1 carbohydrate ABC transporter permease [Pectobacterium atrosepticum]POW28241.1 ABC transporter permease [Pectobacterium atrosepticum]QWC53243.1 carbohydrate ABC transporter permease [Pectobacterium atrosepticum]